METYKKIHDKAIRLLEGGIVEVDGHFVRLLRVPYMYDPCYECKMECICHIGTDICNLCCECDTITGEYCMLKFAYEEVCR